MFNKGIDYSKWDHFGDSDDDSDNNNNNNNNNDNHNNNNKSGRPQVTRLDRPSQVTIRRNTDTNENEIIITNTTTEQHQQQQQNTNYTKSSSSSSSVLNTKRKSDEVIIPPPINTTTFATTNDNNNKNNTSSNTEQTANFNSPVNPQWIDKGGCTTIAISGPNITNVATTGSNLPIDTESETGINHSHSRIISLYWCQDRATITIRMPLHQLLDVQRHETTTETTIATTTDPKLLVKNLTISVSNILAYDDRCTAVGQGTKQVLSIRTKQDSVVLLLLLEGTLLHPVYLPHDEDTIDWMIENDDYYTANNNNNNKKSDVEVSNKVVTIMLYKATPMMGLIIWWKKPFQECTDEIALTWLADNNNNNTNSFQNVWNQAHEQFLAKRKNNNDNDNDSTTTPISI